MALIERCLAPLEGRDVVAAMRVCSKWRRVLEAATEPDSLAARLEAGRTAEEARLAKYDYTDDEGNDWDYESYQGYEGYHSSDGYCSY
ncbi:hypothetical protein PLESTM_000526700 [Pleodorina starrii]|nr:hypothetical protein PLESTM_000526700 [Pleodorina starrii]